MEFNPQQQQAIDHEKGPLLILAGAGSGKTRVVTQRIVKLLEKGVLPSEILAVTFTNKAAEEMKKRVQESTQAHVLTCTFHSLGVRILRESISALDYSPSFTIYDEEDSLKLLKQCLESQSWKGEKSFVKEIKGLISKAKNALLSPEECSKAGSDFSKHGSFSFFYSLYQQKLKESNALDFDDLLFLTVKLLQTQPETKALYQNRWRFLCIDEYQDTNVAQYTLVKLLVEKHQNLFAVGDPDQSIYSWRGACYRNILNFDKDFPQASVIRLEQNYRSTQTILNAANELIANNPKRLEKKLWSQLGEGKKIGLSLCVNERKEAEFIVERILFHLQTEQIPLDQIAIFYRTNAQSRLFEDLLLTKRIPYVIFGGLSFYQRREIKDMLAFLRIALLDSDLVSFFRTINLPKRGLGKASLANLQELAERESLPIFQLCQRMASSPSKEDSISSKQKVALKDYVDMIFSIKRAIHSGQKISETIAEIIRCSRYLDYLKEDPETFDDRKENLEELIAKAFQWEEDKEEANLQSFLEEISLMSSLEENDRENSIRLMTLHHSKGLEFMLVFIAGLEEDLFPHINARDDEAAIEEERRLCYVGMTRARKKLYLSGALERNLWGSPRFMKPSRFLEEVPSHYIENLSPHQARALKARFTW